MEGRARALVVMVGERLQPKLAVGERGQVRVDRRHCPEGDPARLEGKRDRYVRPAATSNHLERVQLERREVVEAVDEQRGVAPAGRLSAQGVEGSPLVQLAVCESSGIEELPVAVVDPGDLLRVGS